MDASRMYKKNPKLSCRKKSDFVQEFRKYILTEENFERH